MFEDIQAALNRDVADATLPEHVRRMAENLQVAIDLYLKNRFPDARRRTDPSGTPIVKPAPK